MPANSTYEGWMGKARVVPSRRTTYDYLATDQKGLAIECVIGTTATVPTWSCQLGLGLGEGHPVMNCTSGKTMHKR